MSRKLIDLGDENIPRCSGGSTHCTGFKRTCFLVTGNRDQKVNRAVDFSAYKVASSRRLPISFGMAPVNFWLPEKSLHNPRVNLMRNRHRSYPAERVSCSGNGRRQWSRKLSQLIIRMRWKRIQNTRHFSLPRCLCVYTIYWELLSRWQNVSVSRTQIRRNNPCILEGYESN